MRLLVLKLAKFWANWDKLGTLNLMFLDFGKSGLMMQTGLWLGWEGNSIIFPQLLQGLGL